ncbi:MAG: DNA polymerase III subunit gamma/tau, partial [Chloroflexi bacterium]|nr:DNA polymerase III subunit gamma/tau [Chloroflexota bacterium]
MASLALYRKYRPQTFDDVVGQGHITRTLRNALSDGRIVHAYLFSGPRGTGKTSTARLLAKAVNCLDDDPAKRPCNRCAMCQAINEGRSLDLIEIDAASNRGIDEIREIREKVNFRPNEARYKVYVVDEVHMLTEHAFNALLKTLEEPPPHAIFVLATTDPQKVPATVASRCQRFDFWRIAPEDMVRHMGHIAQQEGIEVEPAALEIIVRQATGSARDAVSLLDQLVSFGGQRIALADVEAVVGAVPATRLAELADALLARDLPTCLRLVNQAAYAGVELGQFTKALVEYLRGLLLLRVGDETTGLLNRPAEEVERMREQAGRTTGRELLRLMRLFQAAALELRDELLPQIPVEMACVEACLQAEASPPALREAALAEPAPPASRPTPPSAPPTSRPVERPTAPPPDPPASRPVEAPAA